MQKRLFALALALLSLLCLGGCSEREVPMSAETPVVATAEPTEAPVTELVLTGSESEEELLALAENDALVRIDATMLSCSDALLALWEEIGDRCEIVWEVPIGDEAFSSLTTELDFSGKRFSGNSELLEKLRFLPCLERVNLMDCGLTHEEIAPIADRYESVRFLWVITVLNYNVRTDAQVFSTLRGDSDGKGGLTEQQLEPIFRYCKDLRALDVGHGQIRDISAIAKLKKLKVLILADNYITDISPLAELKELEYLELFMNEEIRDFSPLNALRNMVDINLSYDRTLHSLDFIEYMPKLKKCWIRGVGMTSDAVSTVQAQYPNVEIKFASPSISSTCGDWRATDRNIAIRTAFHYWSDVIEFRSWDDILWREGADIRWAQPKYS